MNEAVGFYAYGCPVHEMGYDAAERRCSCRLATDDEITRNINRVINRRADETDAEWEVRKNDFVKSYKS